MTGREGRTYAITNTKLVLEDGILWDGAITYRDGKILQVGAKGEISIPQDAEVFVTGRPRCFPPFTVS